MDNSQDELGIDNENNRTIFLRESDPFLPMISSPEIEEEPLEGGLNAPPTTPLHSPHTFLKEDRWLFSPLPVLTAASTRLDNFRTELVLPPPIQKNARTHQFLGKRQPALLPWFYLRKNTHQGKGLNPQQ